MANVEKCYVLKLDTDTGEAHVMRIADTEQLAANYIRRFNMLAERARKQKFVGFDNIVYIYAPCR